MKRLLFPLLFLAMLCSSFAKAQYISISGGGQPGYGLTVATPTFSPVAGSYSSTQTVTISTITSLAVLCYTTDGSTPTESGNLCSGGTTQTYSTPISVSTSQTVKAIGTRATYTDSSVGTAIYTITGSNTWTLVRHTLVLIPCNISSSCSASVSAIGSGNVLVLVESGDIAGAGPYINGGFGATGGTWAHPGGTSAGACSVFSGAVGMDCAYVLHSTSCSSSCNITWTTGGGEFYTDSVDIFEYTPSTGSASYDTANTVNGGSSFSTTPPGVALTISGTSDLVVQSIEAQDNYCTAISGSYTSATDFGVSPNNHGGYAAAVNLSSVSAPTWTCSNTRYLTMAVAFK